MALALAGARRVAAGSEPDAAPALRATDLLVAAIAALGADDVGALSDSAARSAVHAASALMDELPPSAASHVSFELVRRLPATGDALDTLGRALQVATAGGMQNKRDEAMAELLARQWPADRLTQIVSALCDVGDLTREELAKAMGKIREGLAVLEPSAVPPVAYQMLKLSRKGCRAEAVDALVAHFDRASSAAGPGANGTAALRHAQGTCLVHLSFAAKVDADMGTEYLRTLKARAAIVPTPRLSSALAATLLSLAGVPRLATPAQNMIKGRVLAFFATKHRRTQCAWLKSLPAIPDVDATADAAGADAGDPSTALLDVARHSAYGWDHLAPALVELGFLLLDSAASKAGGVAVGSDAVALGSRLLTAVYDAHESARSSIVDGLLSGVASPPKKGTKTITRDAPGAHAALLGEIAATRPATLVQKFAPRLKEALEYYAFLPPGGGAALLTALRPLLRLSQDLRDDALLVLRKATFARDEGARLAAAEGVTSLLLAAVGGDSAVRGGEYSLGPLMDMDSAGGSCSQAMELFAGASAASDVVNELVGLLGRCLHQQATVRSELYESLYRLQLAYPLAQEAACEMLLPHLLKFCADDETIEEPPLRLDEAVRSRGGRAELAEPLGRLVRCCARLLALQPPGEVQARSLTGGASLGYHSTLFTQTTGSGDTGVGSCSPPYAFALKTHTMMQAMFKRLSSTTCDLDDFGLGASADWSGDGGERTHAQAAQLTGVLEVALGHYVELACAPDSLVPIGGSAGGSGASASQSRSDAAERAERLVSLLLELDRAAAAGQGGDKCQKSDKKAVGRGKKKTANASGGAIAATGPAMPLCGARCLAALAVLCNPLRVGGVEIDELREALSSHLPDPSFRLWVASSMRRLLVARGSGDMAADADWIAAGGDSDAVVLSAPAFGVLESCSTDPSPETVVADGSAPALAAAVAEQAARAVEAALVAASANGEDCLVRALSDIGSAAPEADLKTAAGAALEALGKAASGLLDGGAPAAAGACVAAAAHAARAAGRKERTAHAAALATMLAKGAGEAAGRKWQEPLCLALMAPALSLAKPGEDMDLAASLSASVQEIMGPVDGGDGDEEPKVSNEHASVTDGSMKVTGMAVLEAAESALRGVEWLLAPLTAAAACFARSGGDHNGADGTDAEPAAENAAQVRRELRELEKQAAERLESVHAVLLCLFRADPSVLHAKVETLLFKAVTRMYNALSLQVQLATAPKGCKQHEPMGRLRQLAEIVSKDLTPAVYEWLVQRERIETHQQDCAGDDIDEVNEEKRAKKRKRLHTKAARTADRDMRAVPTLIFAVEEYERYLLTLSTESKVNLCRGAKRSVARDFILKVGDSSNVSKSKRRATSQTHSGGHSRGGGSGGGGAALVEDQVEGGEEEDEEEEEDDYGLDED